MRKPLLGNGLAAGDAAVRAGLWETDVLSLLRGSFPRETACRVAPVLGLNADAFGTHSDYQLQPVGFSAIERIELPSEDDHVNACIIRQGDSIVLLDAGFRPADLLGELLARCGRLPDRATGHHLIAILVLVESRTMREAGNAGA